MPQTTAIVQANAAYASRAHDAAASKTPTQKIAIITCMDARIDAYAMFGLKRGEAHVIRNAGALVTDDVIRSLILSSNRLGTRQVMLVGHTNCGLEHEDDAALVRKLTEVYGPSDTGPTVFGGFEDTEAQVRAGVQRIATHPWLRDLTSVRGFILDLDTGSLNEVPVEAPAAG